MRLIAVALLVAPVRMLRAPPTFTMDLSVAPVQRWKGALASVLRQHPWEYSFLPIFTQHNASLFSRLPLRAWNVLTASLDTFYPDHAAELRGIAAEFAAHGHADVTFQYLAGWVWFHELAHTDVVDDSARHGSARECTAMLARDMVGNTLHVGNMDQQPPAVRNATLRVRFIDGNGTIMFEGVDWYWFTTGVSRAVRAGVASMQENWRQGVPIPLQAMLDRISGGSGQAVPQMFVFRHMLLLTPQPKFRELASLVERVPLAAPFYAVLAGPAGDGVIMARNETHSEGTDWLGGHSAGALGDVLVQTNYDRWLPDSRADPRRTRAESMLTSILGSARGQRSPPTEVDLFAVASAYPIHNPHTAYTAVMNPVTGQLSAYVRDSLCPVRSAIRDLDTRYCASEPY